MSTTISLSFDDTFNVFDYVSGHRIGEISLMSDGWAAYQATATNNIKERRIGTYASAQLAIQALDAKNKGQKK